MGSGRDFGTFGEFNIFIFEREPVKMDVSSLLADFCR